MSKPVYLNKVDIYKKYRARLLDYSVSPTDIDSLFFSKNNSVIPVKLKESVGTREITLDLEFEGDTCHDALMAISNITAEFIEETHLDLPDGFSYFCILSGASTPKFKGETFYQVKFSLIGYRHLAMQSHTFKCAETLETTVFYPGNCKAPAIITISPYDDGVISKTVTVNGVDFYNVSKPIVVNGYDKTVMETDGVTRKNKFADCTLTKFPSLVAGYNEVSIYGKCTVTIEFEPIFL